VAGNKDTVSGDEIARFQMEVVTNEDVMNGEQVGFAGADYFDFTILFLCVC